MPSIKPSEGQSLIDLCLQATGTANNLFEAAVLNGVSITQQLDLNTLFAMPEMAALKVVRLFVKTPPASDFEDDNYLNAYEPGNTPIFTNGSKRLEPFTVAIGEGQCLVDIAMQESGTALNLFDLALLNGLSITQQLTVGQIVKTLPVTLKLVKKKFYNGHLPASDFDNEGPTDETKLEGIDYWFVYEYEVQ